MSVTDSYKSIDYCRNKKEEKLIPQSNSYTQEAPSKTGTIGYGIVLAGIHGHMCRQFESTPFGRWRIPEEVIVLYRLHPWFILVTWLCWAEPWGFKRNGVSFSYQGFEIDVLMKVERELLRKSVPFTMFSLVFLVHLSYFWSFLCPFHSPCNFCTLIGWPLLMNIEISIQSSIH